MKSNIWKRIKRRNLDFVVYQDESPCTADFWDWDNWESATYAVLEKFLDKDHSYIDAGVHLGQTILFGSQLSKKCYAVEPDPEALRITKSNINLNQFENIDLIEKALGEDGEVELGLPDSNHALGNSRTSAAFKDQVFFAPSISLPSLIKEKKIDDLNFIKIDVEGMEDLILSQCDDSFNVPMLVEIHTPWLHYKKIGYKTILNFFKRYKYLYHINHNNPSLNRFVSIEDLSKMYIEKEKEFGGPIEAFFSILAFNDESHLSLKWL